MKFFFKLKIFREEKVFKEHKAKIFAFETELSYADAEFVVLHWEILNFIFKLQFSDDFFFYYPSLDLIKKRNKQTPASFT